MSSDNQYTAIGPAFIGFQTDSASIDKGVDASGKTFGIWGICNTGNAVEGISKDPGGGAGVLGAVDTGGTDYIGYSDSGQTIVTEFDLHGVGVAGFGRIGVKAAGFVAGVLGEGSNDNIHVYQGGVGVKGTSGFDDGVVGECTVDGKSGVFGSNSRDGGQTFGVSGTVVSANGAGVYGFANMGYGGRFRGGRAPLLLDPAATSGRPTTGSHQRGELFVDNRGDLFFCKDSGTPGSWFRVQLVPA